MIKNVHNVDANVQTNEIAEMKRSHRVVSAKHHSLVDVFCACNAFLKNNEAFIDERDKDLVNNESRSFGYFYRFLAEVLSKLVDSFECFLLCVSTADNFDQLHNGSRIEEVHTDEVMLEAIADFCYGK